MSADNRRETDIKSKVKKWLDEQGYPLEMRVARTFLTRDWWIHHSRYYEDTDEKKLREIDVLGFADDPGPLELHGNFVIECKVSLNKPWVLFTTTEHKLNPLGYLFSTPMTQALRELLTSLPDEFLMDLVSDLPLFDPPCEGYNLTQALTRGKDVAYSAISSCIKAARTFAQDHPLPRKIYFPVIVIDGLLFKCYLDSKGDSQVVPVSAGSLLQGAGVAEFIHIHVVTESGFDSFLDRTDETLYSIRKGVLQVRPDLLNAIKQTEE